MKSIGIENSRWNFNLWVAFFFIPFGDYRLYLPFALLWILINLNEIVRVIVFAKYRDFEWFFLPSIFLLMLLFIGREFFILPNPFVYVFVLVFQVLIVYLSSLLMSIDSLQKLFFAMLLGFFFDSAIIYFYTLLTNPDYLGYGQLSSPFSDEKINTPHINNTLSAVFSFFFAKYYISNAANRFFSIVMCFLTLFISVSLGGRAFFVIILFTIIYCSFSLGFNSIRRILLISILIFIVFCILIVTDFLNFNYYMDFLIFRFESGAEASRFDLYEQAIRMIPEYPLGGFYVDSTLISTSWFHNIFFDAARIAGWLPLILIFYFFIKLFYIISFSNKIVYLLPYKALLLSLFLIAQQDVIIEGNSKILIMICLVALLISNYSRTLRYPSV